jgi:hypothetical protein
LIDFWEKIEIFLVFRWFKLLHVGRAIDVLELFNWQHFVGVVGALSRWSYQVHCNVQSSSGVWAEFSATFCRSGVLFVQGTVVRVLIFLDWTLEASASL